MAGSIVPELDDELRRRLGRRYGSEIDAWLDELPTVLTNLAVHWEVEFNSVIQRGSMSVVIRCRMVDGRAAVLKVGFDRKRLANEAAALARWHTVHVPVVLAVDETVGALLTEAIEPGMPLAEAGFYPSIESVIGLITSLHDEVLDDRSYPPVAHRIAHLFDSGLKNYEREPQLVEVVPPDLYERGHQLAMRLAEDAPATVLLHGDLTPANVLDGGEERGLVAIDPSPCSGDSAFDAIDLVMWQAADPDTIATRAEQLAPAIGADPERLMDWCTAFAAMNALELAEAPGSSHEQVEFLVGLASRL
jgi:streptomycin 6-kinase